MFSFFLGIPFIEAHDADNKKDYTPGEQCEHCEQHGTDRFSIHGLHEAADRPTLGDQERNCISKTGGVWRIHSKDTDHPNHAGHGQHTAEQHTGLFGIFKKRVDEDAKGGGAQDCRVDQLFERSKTIEF